MSISSISKAVEGVNRDVSQEVWSLAAKNFKASSTSSEVDAVESHYKRALMTREFGLIETETGQEVVVSGEAGVWTGSYRAHFGC